MRLKLPNAVHIPMINRLFGTSSVFNKIQPTNLKGKSVSSQHWLTRQLNDPYVEKAKVMNYRCRSAFKLLEVDDKYKFLKPGSVVIDCGAAPGSWTQVAANRALKIQDAGGTPGIVIGIDKLHIHPIQDAITLGNSDFTKKEVQDKVLHILGDNKAHVVLSDMAPSATGIREMDNENMLKLCYTALRFAVQVSQVNATFLVKLWQCNELKKLESDIKQFYDETKIIKPKASRSDSAEIYLLGRSFKGLLKDS